MSTHITISQNPISEKIELELSRLSDDGTGTETVYVEMSTKEALMISQALFKAATANIERQQAPGTERFH